MILNDTHASGQEKIKDESKYLMGIWKKLRKQKLAMYRQFSFSLSHVILTYCGSAFSPMI